MGKGTRRDRRDFEIPWFNASIVRLVSNEIMPRRHVHSCSNLCQVTGSWRYQRRRRNAKKATLNMEVPLGRGGLKSNQLKQKRKCLALGDPWGAPTWWDGSSRLSGRGVAPPLPPAIEFTSQSPDWPTDFSLSLLAFCARPLNRVQQRDTAAGSSGDSLLSPYPAAT